MTEPFVEVRAETRFMVYGQSPARGQDVEIWILRVPESWVEGVAPGASSPKLTERCHQAVERLNEKWRKEAIASAEAAEAAGGAYDAGHHILLGTRVRVPLPWELHRRPWTRGHHHFFYVADEGGALREGTEADAPPVAPLTPFEEQAFAGWRAEQVELWRSAAASYTKALGLADVEAHPALVGEAAMGLVRATLESGNIDKAAEAARGVLARGLPDEWKEKILALLAEARRAADRAAERKRLEAEAVAALPPPEPVDHGAPGPRKADNGFLLMQRSNYPAAIETLQAALEETLPGSGLSGRPKTMFNLGLALEHEGRLDEAQALFRSALAAQGQKRLGSMFDALDSELALARVLARSGSTHAAESRAILDRTRPQVTRGRGTEGHHLWAEALLDHAVTGETSRARALIDRAWKMIRWNFIYGPWLKRDRARLAAGSA